MDSSKKHDNPNPRAQANYLSLILFWWLKPLFFRKSEKDLELKDLYNNLDRDLSEPLANDLERYWNEELKQSKTERRKPQLLRAIKRVCLWPYLYFGAWIFLLCVVLRVLLPYLLGLLIWHFDPRAENSTLTEAYVYASGVIILSILVAMISRQADLGQMEIGMRLRVACCSLMYRKILRLSCTASNETTQGQIINLMSNDVARFDRVFIFLHYIWIMPFQAAVITYMIWRNVEVAALTGVLLIAVQAVFIQGYMGKLISKLRMKIAIRCDERVRVMGEIIRGVRVIKMYTWEKPFEILVAKARSYEVQALTLMSYIKGFNVASYAFTERTTLYLTILVYVLQDNKITADKAFSMAQYFNILQLTMAIIYPLAIAFGAESLVSVRRIENFLMLEERTLSVKSPVNERGDTVDVKLQNIKASWSKDHIVNTLYNINLTVPKGQLFAIIGPVGSGKSSLLKAILDEIPITNGQLFVNKEISYAGQESWLFPGTVQNNILFGEPYVKEKYEQVVKACALNRDFELLLHGDKTYIGDRGASLSGGQCARVNLARAVYRNARIYLLDDPLSAVDSHVGKYLFNECINGYLKTKTRILVTHQIQYLKNVDNIVLMKNGKIEKIGTYAEILTEGLDFHVENSGPSQKGDAGDNSSVANSESKELTIPDVHQVEDEEPEETEELIAKGKMSKMLFWKYFHAGAPALIILFTLVFSVIVQCFASGTDYWIAYWTREEESRIKDDIAYKKWVNDVKNETNSLSNDTINQIPFNESSSDFLKKNETEYLSSNTALYVYSGLVIAHIITSVLKNMLFYKICMNASKNLHNSMFSCLLKAPMRFFDTNPSGRILNRFSKDIGAIDESLPDLLLETKQITFVMLGIMAQVLIINWWTIFPIIILGILFWLMRRLYMSTAQSIWRLEGVAKSPMFSHVNSSLSGITTIRSFEAQDLVSKEFDSHQDLHTRAHDLSIVASNAFGFWIEMASIGFVAFVTYSFIIVDDGNTFAGNVGLALSQVLILCGMLQHGMRQLTETVAKMTSVERVVQFTELENEGKFDSDLDKKPPNRWPEKGRIEFQNVYLKYSESDAPVLKNLNFVIEPGMKVGVVGRTGAGKSSLITALFHLAKVDGRITLDKVDTLKIGLHDLRKKMSIIPQDPMLFSATLRDNLDPFHEYEDLAIWSALGDVELKHAVTALDQQVAQGGNNFSTGQRQLLCLARAIIRRNKVLVLDEATANVDPKTDELIQQTVRLKFRNCTVITIAHRLHTIIDSDKVLVMSDRRAVEFDHPHVLLQKSDGVFTKLVMETGPLMSQQLKNDALKAFREAQEDGREVESQQADLKIVEKKDEKDEKVEKIEINEVTEKTGEELEIDKQVEESANEIDNDKQKEMNSSHEQIDSADVKSEDSQDDKNDKSEPTSTKQEQSEVEETKTEIATVPDVTPVSENVTSDVSSPD